MQSGIAWEKNGALSVDQCWPRVLQFSVHLIDFLSILLDVVVSAGIQKAVVDQTADYQTVTMTFVFGASSALGSTFEFLLIQTIKLAIASCHIKSTFCHISHSD